MDNFVNGNHHSPSPASHRDVNYSCGSCGYDLGLSSSDRNTATIGSQYGKSIRRGTISFFQIDDSRFTHIDEIQCCPWGLFRNKTKLPCRKCGNHIGNAYNRAGSDHSPANKEPISSTTYKIKLRALQPSSSASDSHSC